MKGSFLLMGTGGSMGVPVIGCSCLVCQSSNPYNKRTRSACLVTVDGKIILIDVGPDFRLQALTYKISSLDAIMITHSHQDHVGGIDDLRPFFFYRKKPAPCFMSEDTFSDLKHRFPYIFKEIPKGASLVPRFDVQVINHDRGRVAIEGVPFFFTSYHQMGMKVLGFKLGDLGYVSDIKDYSESIFEDLQGVKTLVVSALRHESNSFHFTVDEAVAFAGRVGAKKTWLTHIAHELDHDKTNAELPDGIEMAYDGLEISFEM